MVSRSILFLLPICFQFLLHSKCEWLGDLAPPIVKTCNATALNEKCRTTICIRILFANCTYTEYNAEYCECCKKCVYPPPRPVSNCPPSNDQYAIAPCAQFIRRTCTGDEYIEELCANCTHCPYRDL